MRAKVLIGFNAYNIIAHAGEEIEITNQDVFLDLSQAGFVEQLFEKPTSKSRKKKESKG